MTIQIGQIQFSGADEVWDVFTNYQPVEEFLDYRQPGQSVAEQIRTYLDDLRTDDLWRDFFAGVNGDAEHISEADARDRVAAIMTDYAERHTI
jgi:hypothetical protein